MTKYPSLIKNIGGMRWISLGVECIDIALNSIILFMSDESPYCVGGHCEMERFLHVLKTRIFDNRWSEKLEMMSFVYDTLRESTRKFFEKSGFSCDYLMDSFIYDDSESDMNDMFIRCFEENKSNIRIKFLLRYGCNEDVNAMFRDVICTLREFYKTFDVKPPSKSRLGVSDDYEYLFEVCVKDIIGHDIIRGIVDNASSSM